MDVGVWEILPKGSKDGVEPVALEVRFLLAAEEDSLGILKDLESLRLCAGVAIAVLA